MPDREEPASTTQPGDPDPRVFFAGIRTLLAWIRTSLAMMGFGFVIARFGLFLRELAYARIPGSAVPTPGVSAWVGTALIAIGSLAVLGTAYQYQRFLRRYSPADHDIGATGPWTIAFAAVIGVVGLGLTVYLAVAGR